MRPRYNLPMGVHQLPGAYAGARGRGQVLRSLQPSFPSEFETQVTTVGYWADAGINNTNQAEIKTNSLLSSSHGLTTVQQSGAAVNIGRNYTKYRVVAYDLKITAISRSTSDYLLLEVHSPDDLAWGAGTSWNAQTNWLLPAHFVHTVPKNTASPCVLHPSVKKYKLHQITGNNNYLTDETFSGGANGSGVFTDPTNLTYCTLISNLWTGGAQTASNSPHVTVELTQYVKFYDLKT